MDITRKIDFLNIGLILLALIIAFLVPFRMFLLAYAILGPLHYLTEISWLRDKNFFVKEKSWLPAVVIGAFLFMIPFILRLPAFEGFFQGEKGQSLYQEISKGVNAMIFLPFFLAIGMLFAKKRIHLLIFLSIGIVLAVCFHFLEFYHVLIGLFLPTVIHVYLFTLLFMLYGALKSKSKPGIAAVVIALLAPVSIVLLQMDPANYAISDFWRGIFEENEFFVVGALMGKFLGLHEDKMFFYDRAVDVKIQIFIAFAYSYHYLNWFSKTTLIGWAKDMTWKKGLTIGAIWLVSLGLFAYDYRTGVMILLFLSMIHVFLEFPLNMISIRGIFQELGGKKA